MSIAEQSAKRLMTVEEFLAIPEDEISRELIRGELRERGSRLHDRFHSAVAANLSYLLCLWYETQPRPRGVLLSGEAGFRLPGPPDSAVGIDVAYVSAELLAETGPEQEIFHGAPVLAVEILAGSDTHGDVVEKIELYLEYGTVVWIVDPDLETVTVHRPGEKPVLFNTSAELDGEPYLPGFRVPVASFFE